MGKSASSKGKVPWHTNSSVISIAKKLGDNKIKAQCLRVGGGHSGHK